MHPTGPDQCDSYLFLALDRSPEGVLSCRICSLQCAHESWCLGNPSFTLNPEDPWYECLVFRASEF